jgi:hypothetical protein
MTSMAEAIERYLTFGEYEIDHLQWPGQNITEKSKSGHEDHLRALVAEVKRRSKSRSIVNENAVLAGWPGGDILEPVTT